MYVLLPNSPMHMGVPCMQKTHEDYVNVINYFFSLRQAHLQGELE